MERQKSRQQAEQVKLYSYLLPTKNSEPLIALGQERTLISAFIIAKREECGGWGGGVDVEENKHSSEALAELASRERADHQGNITNGCKDSIHSPRYYGQTKPLSAPPELSPRPFDPSAKQSSPADQSALHQNVIAASQNSALEREATPTG